AAARRAPAARAPHRWRRGRRRAGVHRSSHSSRRASRRPRRAAPASAPTTRRPRARCPDRCGRRAPPRRPRRAGDAPACGAAARSEPDRAARWRACSRREPGVERLRSSNVGALRGSSKACARLAGARRLWQDATLHDGSPSFMIPARPLASPSVSAPAIRIAGLTHRYGERQALCGIDLDIGRGEVFGVLGPNGGGKTTLFKVLATLLPPQAGEVIVLDENAGRAPERVRRRLGVVFQHPALDAKLTVIENLRCHAALYGLAAGEARERTALLLDRLGIAERGGDLVETLSGGLARRVELAK